MQKTYSIYGKEISTKNRLKFDEISDQGLDEIIDFTKSKSVEVSMSRSASQEIKLGGLDAFDLVSVEYEDGGVWFFSREDYERYMQSSVVPKRSGSSDDLIISPYLKTNKRGGSISEKVIDFIATRPLTSSIVRRIIKRLENAIVNRTTGLYYVDEKKEHFIGKEFDNSTSSNRYLLLIHGTNSSIEGSFSGIIDSTEWQSLRAQYNENIIGLQHRTMSESVLENAVEIYSKLPKNASIDILCFSRGALVAECLNVLIERTVVETAVDQRSETIEYLKEYGSEIVENLPEDTFAKGLEIGKIIRVAGPAAGTSLLGNKIPDFLQALFRMGNRFKILKHSIPFQLVRLFFSVIVSQKDNELTMPGIKNMVPGDELLDIINNSDTFSTPLFSIQGVASTENLPASIKAILANWVFGRSNDLVVDTISMNQGLKRDTFYFKLFSKLSDLNHFKYFSNPITQKKVIEALTVEDEDILKKLFSRLDITEQQTRGISIKQGGEVNTGGLTDEDLGNKEVVVLVPGILGSTLTIGDKLWWVHMGRLARVGALDKIAVNGGAEATGAIGNAYQPFYDEFTKKGYDVLLFPFDWRKSVIAEGKRFAKRINDLYNKGLKIHIVAHSMGGLIVRELMINDRSLQENLAERKGKIMLLGVPWLGSYLILETFNSTGKRFNQLHNLTKFSAWNRKALLKVIYHFKGLWNLLPIYKNEHEDRDFSTIALWAELHKANPKRTLDPDDSQFKAYLQEFASYQKDILDKVDGLFYDNVYYIAGSAPTTTDDYTVHGEGKGVQFSSSYEGDGSVTWSSGIPKQLVPTDRVYYVDVKHGDLCKEDQLFDGYIHILKQNSTGGSKHFLPSKENLVTNRGIAIVKDQNLSNDPQYILPDILDMKVKDPYKKEKDYAELTVEIINGHLKYTKYPLMVGHFHGDDIISAESVVDFLYDNELSTRNNLGVYPGHLGTSLFINSEKEYLKGAIVIGLGTRNALNPQRLQYAIEQSILSFLLNQEIEDKSGISSIIIGSGYGDMVLTECVNAIITGVANANERFREVFPDRPTISNFSLIELYKDKAEEIYEYIDSNKNIYESMNVFLKDRLEQVEGFVEYRNYESDRRWWYNIIVKQYFENGEPVDKFTYAVSSKIARVDTTILDVDKEEIELLLGQIDAEASWQKETIQAAFRMMIPKEIIRLISSNTGIAWILDKYTAVYPWELIFMEKLQDRPTSIQAGMIRQLMIENPKPVKYVNENKICIIADPKLSSEFVQEGSGIKKISQLPGARKEGRTLVKLFKDKYDCKPTDLTHKTYAEIYPKLILDKYKLMHIACHGVVDWGPKKKTGIVFDYKSILTAEKFSNLEYMPDFIFLNCCYSGYISNIDKNKFSANLGISLIENGVKAVIVGAWQIDDRLAMDFAEEFYSHFLDGTTFGEAVRKAREKIYETDSQNNTWAAYQCYGNQYYRFKLEEKSTSTSRKKRYKLKKEIYQDLERIHNYSFAANKRKLDIKSELKEIKSALKDNQLVDEKILEKLARLFAENGDYENAVDLYQKMTRIGDLNYTVWSLGFSKVIEAKYLVQLCRKLSEKEKSPETTEETKAEKKKRQEDCLRMLEHLKEEAETFYQENPNKNNIIIYASIIKSYLLCYELCHRAESSLTKGQQGIYRKQLHILPHLYFEAYAKEKIDSGKNDSHTLCAALYCFSTYKTVTGVKAAINKKLDGDIDIFLEYLLKEDTQEQNKQFWDQIKSINIYEAQLLLTTKGNGEKAKIDEIGKAIKSTYMEYWGSGGSRRNVMAEIDQIDFLLASNRVMGKLSEAKVKALKELRIFYDNLIKGF